MSVFNLQCIVGVVLPLVRRFRKLLILWQDWSTEHSSESGPMEGKGKRLSLAIAKPLVFTELAFFKFSPWYTF